MIQMKTLMRHILDHGTDKSNRTGITTRSVFGYQMRFNLQEGFPLVTGKFTPFKLIASELLWFLKGEQDHSNAIEALHADNNHIWDEWAKEDGSFGPIYGVQWRRWWGVDRNPSGAEWPKEVDQIEGLLNQLVTTPDSRRMIVTAWQPSELEHMALPPCHVLFQLNTRETTREGYPKAYFVDLQLYQRSCDVFLGVPFNIASYALLLYILCSAACRRAGDAAVYLPGELVWTGGDVHLYHNHFAQVQEYLARETHSLPEMTIRMRDSIDDHVLSDFTLSDYKHSGKIAAPVAV